VANWAENAYFQSVFHDAAVDNATDEDDELVASAKATLAKQLELFKTEATIHLDAIFTSEFGTIRIGQAHRPCDNGII
jgi:hypothetical protein